MQNVQTQWIIMRRNHNECRQGVHIAISNILSIYISIKRSTYIIDTVRRDITSLLARSRWLLCNSIFQNIEFRHRNFATCIVMCNVTLMYQSF